MFFDEHWSTNAELLLHTDACGESYGAYFGTSWIMDTFTDDDKHRTIYVEIIIRHCNVMRNLGRRTMYFTRNVYYSIAITCQPRWLSGMRRSRVHSLMIARRSLCPDKLGSNPGQGSKGINFSGWHGLDMSITVTKRR